MPDSGGSTSVSASTAASFAKYWAMSLIVLLAQIGRLGVHSVVHAVVARVALQRLDDVVPVLPAQPRHVIRRVGGHVAFDAVAAEAGVGQYPAALRVARVRVVLGLLGRQLR